MVLCNQDNGELELIGRKIRFMSVRNCVQSFQDEYYRRIQTIYKHSSQTDREPLVRILKTSRNIEMDENSIKRENCSLRFDFHSPRKSVKFRKQINYYVIMCMATDFFLQKKIFKQLIEFRFSTDFYMVETKMSEVRRKRKPSRMTQQVSLR